MPYLAVEAEAHTLLARTQVQPGARECRAAHGASPHWSPRPVCRAGDGQPPARGRGCLIVRDVW